MTTEAADTTIHSTNLTIKSDSPPQTVQAIIEQMVGPVQWISDGEGYCACPGKNQHSTRNANKDCIIYAHGVPTLSCFHAGCREAVKSANQKLRQAVKEGVPGHVVAQKLSKEEEKRIAHRQMIQKRAHNSRATILKQHCWPYAQIINDSPVGLRDNIADHWRLLLNLFDAGDVIWIGSIYDSGQERHRSNFRYREDWLKEAVAPAQFICPSVFKVNSYQRGNDNIITRRFLVVESDELGKDEIGAVFRWLTQDAGLKLRAIVDTAGKSLHAWFDNPAEDETDDLKLILPVLGCDPKLFTPSQPVRLPSAARDGKFQRLVYLAGKEAA